jgi:hypothetical protein
MNSLKNFLLAAGKWIINLVILLRGQFFFSRVHVHGLINYIDIKAICRHLKNLTLWQVFIRVIDWINSQSCGIFDPASRAVATLAFSLVQLPPPLPPSLCE